MTVILEHKLKELLYKSYNGFADKRIKNLDKGKLFIFDNRSNSDLDANGNLFLWFCQIFGEVINADTIKIIMRGDIPQGPLTKDWFAQHNIAFNTKELEFYIKRNNKVNLKGLADAFRNITQPGSHYIIPNYKYVCPRTADAIERLQTILEEAWEIELQ